MPSDQSQSSFTEQSEFLQTPPELQEPKEMSKKSKLIIAGSGAFLLLLIVMVVLIPRRPVIEDVAQIPTPTPVPEKSVYKTRLEALSKEIDEADPDQPLLFPPPVDMTISIQ